MTRYRCDDVHDDCDRLYDQSWDDATADVTIYSVVIGEITIHDNEYHPNDEYTDGKDK